MMQSTLGSETTTDESSGDANVVRSQYATFTLCGHSYGIDVARVQEVLRAQDRTRVPLASPSVAGLINLRGQVLTAIDLRYQLGLPARADDDPEPMVVVVYAGDEPIALLVDTIGGVVQVSEDLFEAPPDHLQTAHRYLLRGAYKLSGTLLLALDVDAAVAT